jgi:tetratricopeptide (TPR) repeat protein
MIKKIIILASILIGVVGGVIFSSHKLVGSVFMGIGAFCAAYTYLSAEAQQRENENLFDAQAQLLFGAGLGNPYTKTAMNLLFKGKASRNCLPHLERALKVSPNDPDALVVYVQIESLILALLKDAGLQNRSVYQLRFKKTEVLIERGIQTKKHLSQFYVARGILLDLRGQHKLARGWFLRSGKLRSDPYWRLLLSTSYEMERDCSSALEEVEKAIEEGAIGSAAALSYGRALLGIGEYSKALSQFRIVRRERGYSYQLLLLVKETYYFNRQPIKAANYELLTAFYVLPMNPRRAVLEIRHAIVHYCLPSFLWLIRSLSALKSQRDISQNQRRP